jgi:chromosome segregation ATPase
MIDVPSQPASVGLQAMLTKSTNEQETLKAQLISAEQDVTRLREELAALQPRHTDIARLRESHQKALATAREQVDQARAKARLAVDTPAEGTTLQKVREASEALAAQQAIVEAEEISLSQESDSLKAKEKELAAQAEQREADRQRLHNQYHGLLATHAQVQNELGEALYGEQLAALEKVEQRCADLADQLVDARVALATAREQVRSTLAPWPALLKQAQAEHTLVDDSLSRILSTYIAYAETLVREAPAIKFSHLNGVPFYAIVALNEGKINNLLGRTGPTHKELQEQVEQVRNLLGQHQRTA